MNKKRIGAKRGRRIACAVGQEHPRLADERANQLLRVFCEIEEFEDQLTEGQFGELLYRAALACGFEDAREAWQAITDSSFPDRPQFLPPKSVS